MRGMTSSFTRFLDHTQRRTSSGRVISSSQRPLPDNTQHSQQTDFHAPGGIRTHDLSRRAAADLRLRPRGHWDRLCSFLYLPKIIWLVILCNGAHSLCSISEVGSGNVIFFQDFQNGSVAHPTSYSIINWEFYPQRVSGRHIKLTTHVPSITEVKNAWSSASTPPLPVLG